MAAVAEYLMSDRDAEIRLARSAAPDSLSRHATILVLGRRGFETAVEGTNGYVCMVERGWAGAFDWPEFWNPKTRGAVCLNPAAARTMLPLAYKRAAMVLARQSKAEIIDSITVAFERNEIPALEPGAMSYMMSKGAYLTDDGDHNGSHLMFYTPLTDAAAWGAGVRNSPVGSGSYWYLSDQSLVQYPKLKSLPPIRIFTVHVATWSDGAPAPM